MSGDASSAVWHAAAGSSCPPGWPADDPGVSIDGPGPVDQLGPHLADQDQRRVVHVPDLQQLPDHQRFEHRADPAGRDDEGVRDQDEVVQPGEERLVLERLVDERIHVLLERQIDANADGLLVARPGRRAGAFVGGLHQPGPAAGDDVAAQVASVRRPVSRTASYTQWSGSTRAEPKIVTR